MKTTLILTICAMCVRAGVAASGIIPIQRTPVYRTLSIEVQMGTPLRTLRMEPDFHTSDIFLAHPDVCQPFVACIAGIESIDQPERPDGAWRLVDGVQALVLGDGAYSNALTRVRYVARPGTSYAERELAGTIGLGPESPIALSNVIEVNTETIVHPDGSTDHGMSIKLHPAGIVDEPGRDIVIPTPHHGATWESRSVPHFAGVPLNDVRATLYMVFPGRNLRDYFKLPSPSFSHIVEIVRKAVGSVHVIKRRYDDHLFVPCLAGDGAEEDPLARLLSFDFGRGMQPLYVNIRHSPKAYYPPAPDSLTVDGIAYCPTVLVDMRVAWSRGWNVVPEMFEGDMKTFLDIRNRRIVFRPAAPGRRDPLRVDPVPLIPSFELPHPDTGSLHFPASAGPAWRLMSRRPHRNYFGQIIYRFELYDTHDAPVRDITAFEYPGEFSLLGSGTVNISDPSMISLPVVSDGMGQRYRLSQQISNAKASYTLTPVIRAALTTPIASDPSYSDELT